MPAPEAVTPRGAQKPLHGPVWEADGGRCIHALCRQARSPRGWAGKSERAMYCTEPGVSPSRRDRVRARARESCAESEARESFEIH